MSVESFENFHGEKDRENSKLYILYSCIIYPSCPISIKISDEFLALLPYYFINMQMKNIKMFDFCISQGKKCYAPGKIVKI